MTIHWYGVMMALGFLAGMWTWIWLGRKRGIDASFCSDLLFWIMAAGVIGGRVAYVLTDLHYYLEHPVRILRIDQGGLVYYGGFVGAALAVIVFARRRAVPLLQLSDLVVTALPLGHALGRIGCFLNGCCHGRAAESLPFAVTYPRSSQAWYTQLSAGLIADSSATCIPVHPVQLYETAVNVAIYAGLVMLYRARPAAGRVTAVYFLVYPAARFFLELFRGDERIAPGGLDLAQWTSLALMAAGAVLWVLSNRSRTDTGSALDAASG